MKVLLGISFLRLFLLLALLFLLLLSFVVVLEAWRVLVEVLRIHIKVHPVLWVDWRKHLGRRKLPRDVDRVEAWLSPLD